MTDTILKEATKRFGQAEVYRLETESHPVSFESNRLKEISSSQQSGVALRVIKDGRIGFTSTTNPDIEPDLVDRAAALAEFGSEAFFEFPPPSDYPDVPIVDDRISDVTIEQMVATGKELIERLREPWPDLLCDASVGRAAGRMWLSNSNGVEHSYRQTSYHVFLGGQLIRGTDMLNIWAGHNSSRWFGDDEIERILSGLLRQLEYSKELASAPSGDVPVVFTPRGVRAALLGPLLSGFNGKNIATGSSPLVGRVGEKAVDTAITLFDDPTIPYASGSRPCDDEGLPSKRLTLIQNGVIGGGVFDLQTAGKAGAESTASAHRGLASTPSPGWSVIDMAGGGTPRKDLFDGIKEGLVVEQLLGAGQGNELGGDFKANVALGYRIENGEIVGRVKDTMIAGNVYETLNSVEAVSAEPEWVFGSARLPAIRCRGVQVAASDG